jgi:hypothetical protein
VTGMVGCTSCAGVAEPRPGPADAYLRAERAATAQFRSAGVATLPPVTGARVATGAYPLRLCPPGARPAPLDLPPVIAAAVLRAHGRQGARLLRASTGADDTRRSLARLLNLPVPVTDGAVNVVFPAAREPDLTLVRILLGSTDLAGVQAVAPSQARWVLAQCRQALTLLESVEPELAAGLVELVAALVILVRRRTAGGSSSGALGAIWLSPSARWPIAKWVEMMVHEFVHQSLYLDELVHGLFALPADQLDAPEHRVVSAVRKVPRSYDLAFHAAYVGYVQRRLYARLGVADPKPAGPLDTTLDGLVRREACLTGHGQQRLRELVDLDQRYPAETGDGIG